MAEIDLREDVWSAAAASTIGCISIILPTRDRADILSQQLAGVARQHYDGRWELVVVDNGSRDRTREVVHEFEDRMPVQLVRAAARSGAAYARNVGAGVADGDYLLFIDDDDVVLPGWLSAMAAAAEHAPIVRGRDRPMHRGPHGLDIVEPDREGLSFPFYFLPSLSCANSGLRTDLFRATGGFSERYARLEDTDLFWRAQLVSGATPEFVPDAVVLYRLRSGMVDIFRQGFADSMAVPALFRDFRSHGMERSPLIDHLRGWKRVVTRSPSWMRTYEGREQLATHLGWLLGRMAGSMGQHVLCL